MFLPINDFCMACENDVMNVMITESKSYLLLCVLVFNYTTHTPILPSLHPFLTQQSSKMLWVLM